MKFSAAILICLVVIFGCGSSDTKLGEYIATDYKIEIDDKDTVVSLSDKVVKETTSFSSKDSLKITADFYIIGKTQPLIILCHQAGYSRGEYIESAHRLNKLGFNCIAIDQRSGKEVNGVVNETAKLAKEKGLSTGYIDAAQDISSVVEYMTKSREDGVILVGSSYSASLVLLIGKKISKVKAIAAFSPGEYLRGMNIQDELKGLSKPTFVTSSKSEAKDVLMLLSKADKESVTQFIPESDGDHGSKVLWSDKPYSEEYWKAFEEFLESLKN